MSSKQVLKTAQFSRVKPVLGIAFVKDVHPSTPPFSRFCVGYPRMNTVCHGVVKGDVSLPEV